MRDGQEITGAAEGNAPHRAAAAVAQEPCAECARPAKWIVDMGDGPTPACDDCRARDDRECDALELRRAPWQAIGDDSRHVGAIVGLVLVVLTVAGCGEVPASAGEVVTYCGSLAALSLASAWIGWAAQRAVRG